LHGILLDDRRLKSGGPAPPKTEFSGVSSALEYIQEYARPLGFCVVIRSSEKDKNRRPFKTYFRCDRGTKYVDYTKSCAKPRKKRLENGVLAGTGSRKTNCPFQLRLQFDIEGIWRLYCNQLCHNHPLSLNSSAHPTFRRKDIQLHEDEIIRSYNAGESTRTIMAKLRATGGKALPRDIFNLGQRIRLESLGGLTPIQWLKQELDIQGYYNRIDVDQATNKVI
jgi:hypothetical protein